MHGQESSLPRSVECLGYALTETETTAQRIEQVQTQ